MRKIFSLIGVPIFVAAGAVDASHNQDKNYYERASEYMWDFYEFLIPVVEFCWRIIIFLYEVVSSMGLFGAILAFVVGMALSWAGNRLLGQPGFVTGVVSKFGSFTELYNTDPVEGHAETFIGVLFGGFLRILAIVFIGVAIIAGTNSLFS